ncbi:MAG: GRAM domain-containing protein [Acidobacteriota bacterium]
MNTIRSSLDKLRKLPEFPLEENEKIIEHYTASYDMGNSQFSSWRLGNLYLTNKRVFFAQGRKIIFNIPMSQIKDINIVERRWILGKKIEQLRISWGDTKTKFVYIGIKNPAYWKDLIEAEA